MKGSSLLLILTLLVSSCQPSSDAKRREGSQKLRINLASEPQTLDPRAARGLNELTLMRMFFEGLTRIGKEEKPELALAKEIEISEDLKTYTFHLRSATWTNGEPVTAGDFVYAWRKMLDPGYPADSAFQLYVIKNAKAAKQGILPVDQIAVHAVDHETLKVELEQPTPYFLELLASPSFFPVHQKTDEKNAHWMENASGYVSNGPFCLAEWKHQNYILAKRNLSYWDREAVALAEIEMVMVKEETELKMFEKHELDWAGSPLSTLPVDALKILKSGKNLHVKPILGTYFLRTNIEKAPFDNPKIRWAFALAIHRQDIVEHVTQGNQIPATSIVPLSMQLQKEPYFQDGDTEMARSLFNATLRELQVTKEQLPEIVLTYAMNERNHLIAQALQQQWFEALGIRIKLEGIERKVYFDRLSKRDYQLSSGNWLADFNDPINFLEVFKYKTASTNNTQWEDPQFAGLLEDSMRSNDYGERSQLLSRSERILMDAMPAIPLYHYTLLYMKDDKLKDVVLTSMGQIDFKWVRFEEK
ncbi:MAG: peptide ABC transporter substrate-binding protein [Chlamydiales bacterium]